MSGTATGTDENPGVEERQTERIDEGTLLKRIDGKRDGVPLGPFRTARGLVLRVLRMSPERHRLLAMQVPLLMQAGKVPILRNKATGPYGKPYEGAHIDDSTVLGMLDDINQCQDPQLEYLIPEVPEGNVEVVELPFASQGFLKPADPEEIKKAGKEGTLGFQFENRRAPYASYGVATVPRIPGTNRLDLEKASWSNTTTLPLIGVGSDPNEQSRHYGSTTFEGIGVERALDGNINAFRLEEHYERIILSSKRLGLPPIPKEIFMRAVLQCIDANRDTIPERGQGRLYIRPNIVDFGPHLKVGHSTQFLFTVTAFAIGTAESYFKARAGMPTTVGVSLNKARVQEGAHGDGKIAGSYAASLVPVDKAAEQAGCEAVIFTNPGGQYVRETQASGVMLIRYKGEGRHQIVIPKGKRDVLNSVTVRTICEMASDLGYEAVHEDVTPDQLIDFDEILIAGTAAAIIDAGVLKFITYDHDDNVTIKEVMAIGAKDRMPGLQEVGKHLFQSLCAIKDGSMKNQTYKDRYLTKVPEGPDAIEELLARMKG